MLVNGVLVVLPARAALLLGGAILGLTSAQAVPLKSAGPAETGTRFEQEMVSQLIVKPRAQAGAKLAAALQRNDAGSLSRAANAQLTVVRPMAGGAHLLALQEAVALSDARGIAQRLMREGSVEYAEPDRVIHPIAVTPNDPYYNGADNKKQWHYFAPSDSKGGADLANAWHYGLGNASIVVAVLDTGDIAHNDLPSPLAGYDFISSIPVANDGDGRDNNPTDPGDGVAADECGAGSPARESSWHGLHVTGTIAALMNNNIGGTGVAPHVRVLPVRVLGKCGGYMSDLADAMRWAAGLPVSGAPLNQNPAHVLNLSLGASGACSKTLQETVNDVVGAGKAVVAAAGNDAGTSIAQPANCNGVIGVTAHASDGDNANYANIGRQVSISAPGGGCGSVAKACTPLSSQNGLGVLSLHSKGTGQPSTDYAVMAGTSAAVPHVSGAIALMQSRKAALNLPLLRPAQIKSYLQSSARVHPNNTLCRQDRYLGLCGEGMLDANGALQKVDEEAPTLVLANHYQVVVPGANVVLSGTGDTGDIFEWTQTYGSDVGLSGTATSIEGLTSTATAGFSAPASGVYSFQLQATDSSGRTGKATAIVRVNSAPELRMVGTQTVMLGNGLSFAVTAADPEGDPMTFHAEELPAGASLNSAGIFSWPNPASAGSYVLSYHARDEFGNRSVSGNVGITVAVPAVSKGGGGSSDPLSVAALALLAACWRRQRSRRQQDTAAH